MLALMHLDFTAGIVFSVYLFVAESQALTLTETA